MAEWLDTLRAQYTEFRPRYSVVTLVGPQTEHEVYLDHVHPMMSVSEAVSRLAASRFDVVGIFEETADGHALRILRGAERFAALLPDPSARISTAAAANDDPSAKLLRQYRRIAVTAVNRGKDFAQRSESRRFYKDDVARFVLDADRHLFKQSSARVFLLLRSWGRFRERILASDNARRAFREWTATGSLRSRGHAVAVLSPDAPEPADHSDDRLLSARETLRIEVQPPRVEEVEKCLLALHFGGTVAMQEPRKARHFAEKLMSEVTERGLVHLTRFHPGGISDSTVVAVDEYAPDDIRPLESAYVAVRCLQEYIDTVVMLLTKKDEVIAGHADRLERSGVSRAEAMANAGRLYSDLLMSANALLYGPPGTGKTSLVREIARRLQGTGIPVKHVTAGSLNTEGLKDRSLQKLQQMEEQWLRHPACIVYFNEADSYLTKDRFAGGDAGLVNELKNVFEPAVPRFNSIIFIVDTNDPEQIDDAVHSRCQERLYIGMPPRTSREKMLGDQLQANALRLADGFSLGAFAEMAEGRSFRDIANIVRRAVIRAQKKDAPIDRAFVQSILGPNSSARASLQKFATEQQRWEEDWAAEMDDREPAGESR